MQTVDGDNCFLQYHRTRNFVPSRFILERDLENGEVAALFVRGATMPEGISCNVTVAHANALIHPDYPTPAILKLPNDEEGAFDSPTWWVFPELMAPRRKVQGITGNDLDWIMVNFIENHLGRSQLFKPEVSLIIDLKRILPRKEQDELELRALKTGQDQRIMLYVISDGRKAYVKRI